MLIFVIKAAVKKRSVNIKPGLNMTTLFILLYWLFSLISTLLSDYRLDALTGMGRHEGLITLTLYCLVFLIFSVYARPSRSLLYTFGAAMAVFCLLSFLQIAGGNPLGLFPKGTDYSGMNVDYSGQFIGTVGNAGLAAALLCIAVPVFAFSALKIKKYVLFLPALLCLLLLILIDVKAGIVGVVAGMLLSLPVVFNFTKKTKAAVWLSLLGLFIIAALTLYFYDFGGSGMLWEAHQILRGSISDSYGTSRIYIWRNVLALVPERPFFGGGPDTLVHYMAAVFTRETETGVISKSIDAAHNEYLNILVNQGLFALLFYLAALVTSLVKWLKNKEAAAAVCGAAMLCYCIQAFFGISQSITAIYFWVLWGLSESGLSAGLKQR
jgi:O-antigen ligase